MATLASSMMALGTQAPAFNLKSSDGTWISLANYQSAKGLVVLFICNHCPYVIHIAPALAKLAAEYQQKGIDFVAINSNDASQYPADSFANMHLEKQKQGYTFSYLYDPEQSVAKAYDAVCTPDIFLFDEQQKLVYRGQFDSTRPHRISSGNYDSSQNPATGEDLAAAMDALLNNQPINPDQTPSIGCSIKWKQD
ncbi:thioredoxin family protein [Gayadomonas joobiniege]|uniref:thioredoxin family protein n=1 Tax=Gayadomonas joobiniege TaxID=1234606 RepID=UPI000361FBC9|nr:thioredoxin family protein [Gayadomonas joobiniege]